MKKSIFMIALLAVSLISTSGFRDDSTGARVGRPAPALALGNAESPFTLGQCRGEYVLLTFWSASDAASREQCNRYSAWAQAHPDANVRHISVNFDTDRAIFEETVAVDGLDASAQYNVQGDAAQQIMGDYRLDGGFGSVLIYPDGRIDRINPPTSYLSSLL